MPCCSIPEYAVNPHRCANRVIVVIGTSTVSWEEAAKNAIEVASKSFRNISSAKVTDLDMEVENGKVNAYRARVSLSFKYEDR